jgi:hypothetical protein
MRLAGAHRILPTILAIELGDIDVMRKYFG